MGQSPSQLQIILLCKNDRFYRAYIGLCLGLSIDKHNYAAACIKTPKMALHSFEFCQS